MEKIKLKVGRGLKMKTTKKIKVEETINIVKCDSCKKEIDSAWTEKMILIDTRFDDKTDRNKKEYDICTECQKDIKKYLRLL